MLTVCQAHMYVDTLKLVWKSEVDLGAIFSGTIYIGFFREAISLAWSSTCRLSWLAREPQESACFCLQVYVWILGVEVRSSHSLRGNYLYYVPSPAH